MFNMNNCKVGDVLILRNGEHAEYHGIHPTMMFWRHLIKLQTDQRILSLLDDGLEFAGCLSDRDVLGFLYQKELEMVCQQN